MPFIRCTRKNASHEISGVAFQDHPEGGVVSVADLDEAQAARFLSIPGYAVARVEPVKPAAQKKPSEKSAAADSAAKQPKIEE